MNPDAIVFSGETQLAGWSESHTGGAKITLWLTDHAQLDAFRALTVRKGNTAGHRMMVALAEIGDDEQPVIQPEPEPERKLTKPELVPDPPHLKGGALAKLAGIWCSDPAFRQWLGRELPEWWPLAQMAVERPCSEAELAAEVIRQVCDCYSRAELDHNARAAELFHRLIRGPYMKHVACSA